MTEDEIERRVEKYIDNLDRRYLSNQGMTNEAYKKEMADLNAWADNQRKLEKQLAEQKKADAEEGAPLGWTGAQVRALRDVFDRQPLVAIWNGKTLMPERAENYGPSPPLLTYDEFAKLAHVSFGALMVPWCGMWLGIEPDGYTHS